MGNPGLRVILVGRKSLTEAAAAAGSLSIVYKEETSTVRTVLPDTILGDSPTQNEDNTPMIAVTEDASHLQNADVILVTVKSRDTEQAAQTLKEVLRLRDGPPALVYSLQNGVRNHKILSQNLPLELAVTPLCTSLYSHLSVAGHAAHHGAVQCGVVREQLHGCPTAHLHVQGPTSHFCEV